MFARTFAFAGELPKELGKLVNLEVFSVRDSKLEDELYVPAYMRRMFADIFTFFAGELPKELGDLINLTVLDVSRNSIGGKLYVPTYMRCMFAGISIFCRRIAQGARQSRQSKRASSPPQCIPRRDVPRSAPAYMRCLFADILLGLQENCPRSSATSST